MLNYLYYFGYQYYVKKTIQKIQTKMGIEPDIILVSNGYHRKRLNIQEGSHFIKESLENGHPFFAGRFGACELSVLRQFDFSNKEAQNKAFKQLCLCAGFFPENIQLGQDFCRIYKESATTLDILGTWSLPMEDYYINQYTPKECRTAFIDIVDPRTCQENPWSAVLKGKKVLIVHPFTDTIRKQYDRRHLLYENSDFLPDFDIVLYKAVQTIAGEKDERFATWFEALDFMTMEIQQLDFDVALIGCGAYGFPLAARVKAMGKQAIHVGGILQTLFGISGSRWDAFPDGRNAKFRNEYWVYPSEDETPQNANLIEGGAYWRTT